MADDDIRDELPDDLNATEFVGPYLFPNNSCRRVPGVLYLLIGSAAVAIWLLTRGDEPVLVNTGYLLGGVYGKSLWLRRRAILGWTVALLALLAVLGHGAARYYAHTKRS